MRISANKIAEVAKETIWPTRCAVCDSPGDVLCSHCKEHLPYIDKLSSCPLCGAPNGRNFCTECNIVALEKAELEKYPLDALRSAVVLDEKSIRLITTFKDNFETRLAKVIAKIMIKYADDQWWGEKTLLTFIPSTKDAISKRGFSHMQMIATEIAKMTDSALLSLFLPPKASDQRKLTRFERIQNMQSVIKIDKSKIQKLTDKGYDPKITNVILLDDVCTTGSTLFAGVKALRSCGFPKIFGLTFARAQN